MNSIAYGNGSAYGNIYDSTGATFSNNLCNNAGGGCTLGGNPGFPGAAGGDFHLTPSSPAIDAGASLSEVPTDFEGTPRPQGSAYDIGADEYGAGSGGSPTPIPSPGSLCTQYTSSSQIPQGFGVPWDVTNPSIMLVPASCTPPTLLLKAWDPTTMKTLEFISIKPSVATTPDGSESYAAPSRL